MYAGATFVDRTLTYGPPEPTADAPASGPRVGNGVIAVDVDASTGLASSSETTHNQEPTLRFTEVDFGSAQQTVQERKLSMSAGLWRAEGSVTRSELDSDGNPADIPVRVAVDFTALRHFPECVVQSVDCDGTLDFTHVVTAPESVTISNYDAVIRNVYGETVVALTIEARSLEGRRIAYCCYYVSDEPIQSVLGLRTSSVDDGSQSSGSDRVEVLLRASPSALKVTMVHTVLHASSTSGAEALAHGARLFRAGAPMTDSVVRARSTHALRWLSLWNGDITITERADASEQDRESIKHLNIHVRTSVYMLYTSLRDPNAVLSRCFSPQHRTADDELFRHPTLLALCPWALWLQPIAGPASAWTPLHAVARAILDVWHGYRTTLDRTRLDELFRVARLNLAELDMRVESLGQTSSVGTVRTLRETDVDDDAFTVGLARRAFAAGEQISNTLRIPSDPQWDTKHDSLAKPIQADTNRVVETPTGNADALVLLHPALLDSYAGITDLGTISTVMSGNRDLLESVASSEVDAELPALSLSAISTLASDANRLASYDEACSRCDQAFEWFMQRASETANIRWGFACAPAGKAASDLLACFVYGFLGLRFQGHVTRDGYHTVPAKLLPAPSVTVLPRQVYVVHHIVTRAPGERTDKVVQNSRASNDATEV